MLKICQIFASAVLHVPVEIQWFCRLYCRVKEYVRTGREKMVIDADPDEIYIKMKKRISSLPNNAPAVSSVKYPRWGGGKSLERMPSLTRAKMNQHIANSGKKMANAEHHSIPTNLRKATMEDRHPWDSCWIPFKFACLTLPIIIMTL